MLFEDHFEVSNNYIKEPIIITIFMGLDRPKAATTDIVSALLKAALSVYFKRSTAYQKIDQYQVWSGF